MGGWFFFFGWLVFLFCFGIFKCYLLYHLVGHAKSIHFHSVHRCTSQLLLRLYKQFLFKQKDKSFTLCRIISFPLVLFPLTKPSDMSSPLCSWRCECPNTVLSGEGCSVPIFQELDAWQTARGPRRWKCLLTKTAVTHSVPQL